MERLRDIIERARIISKNECEDYIGHREKRLRHMLYGSYCYLDKNR
jgi:hypothetical protein